MRVPRNPDRIAEDAPVLEFSSLLIAVSRTTARIGSRSAIERRRPPRRFPTLIVAPWVRAESGKVTQRRSRLDLLAERATAPRAAPQARDAAQLRRHSRPREDLPFCPRDADVLGSSASAFDLGPAASTPDLERPATTGNLDRGTDTAVPARQASSAGARHDLSERLPLLEPPRTPPPRARAPRGARAAVSGRVRQLRQYEGGDLGRRLRAARGWTR